MRTFKEQELKDILENHRKWVVGEPGGERANLSSADLSHANLSSIIEDFYKVLYAAKNEVAGLYDSLIRGKINGSQYKGECACLVGTIANARKEDPESLSINLRPNASREAEKWFLGIQKGDTPQSNVISKLTCEWVEKFATENSITLPEYKLISSFENPELFEGEMK